MSWAIGFDSRWNRDIGYGVPAICDHPGCITKIDRGLAYVCGGHPYGGDRGCGLYFCFEHLIDHERLPKLCQRCHNRRGPFRPKPDVSEWIRHKLTDTSWGPWRKENRKAVKAMKLALVKGDL